jgi:hypothetical protein
LKAPVKGAGYVSRVLHPELAAPRRTGGIRVETGKFEGVDPALLWRAPARICEFLLRCSIRSYVLMTKDFIGELFVPH